MSCDCSVMDTYMGDIDAYHHAYEFERSSQGHQVKYKK